MHVAVGHAKLHYAGYFLAKTDTTRAMDTTCHFLHRHQRTHVLVENDALGFLIT